MLAIGGVERREDHGDEYDIFLTEWAFTDEEMEQLKMGGRVCAAVADTQPPETLLRVVAPECSCGERMEWSGQLKSYHCEHDEGSTDGQQT